MPSECDDISNKNVRLVISLAYPLLFLFSLKSQAFPVYLSPEAPFASGQFAREYLEAHTIAVEPQIWIKARTSEGLVGWAPAAFFAQSAPVSDNRSYSERIQNALRVPSAHAKRSALFVDRGEALLRAQPKPQAAIVATLFSGAKLTKISEVELAWGKVAMHGLDERDSQRPSEFWWPISLGAVDGVSRPEKKLASSSIALVSGRYEPPLPRSKSASSRSGPQPAYELAINKNAPTENVAAYPSGSAEKTYSTSDIFERSVYDLAAAPSRDLASSAQGEMGKESALQLVSARGVFKSFDGKSWTRIARFKTGDFPVAISKSGIAFVGSFASFDGAQTFHEFVRWDALIDAIKSTLAVDPPHLQAIETTPLDDQGLRLAMKLEIGLKEPIVAITQDQGLAWQIVKPQSLRR